MSLINDALKRARQAQKDRPPAPAPVPPLRPAEPAPRRPASNSNLIVPTAILVVIALAAFVVWQTSRKSDAQPAPQASVPAPAPAATVQAPAPTAATPAATNDTTVANAPAAAAAKPAAPKLQAIFFNPTRPSAMINGKSVLVGGRVGEFRVAAIEPGGVTLTSATATNVLTLELE
jgi:hypothetical protein